jgi:predicted amidohydrolase
MPRSLRVAALQLRAHDREDFVRTLDAVAATVRQSAQNADVIVLPEATFPAYVLGNARIDEAAIGGALERLSEIAHATQTVIVAGAALREGSALRNTAVVIDADGSIAGSADKVFLWHFDRLWFEAGERIAPIVTQAATLGVLVCADGRIPTIARELVDRGAEMLVMPTAWVTSGRNPSALENVQADLLARVRAYENGVPFVAANKCGAEQRMVAYCGKSQIVDATGETIAVAGQHEPQTLAATVEIGNLQPHRTEPQSVTPCGRRGNAIVRIAISFEPLPQDVERRLTLLGNDCAFSPGEGFAATPNGGMAVARVADPTVLDPGGLVAYRRAGYACAAWSANADPQWVEPIARARALELRMYVIVFDERARRAFAVDPDGTVVAGTFEDYRMASFSLDPRRTMETTVAPGTDVSDGLERVDAIVRNAVAP